MGGRAARTLEVLTLTEINIQVNVYHRIYMGGKAAHIDSVRLSHRHASLVSTCGSAVAVAARQHRVGNDIGLSGNRKPWTMGLA